MRQDTNAYNGNFALRGKNSAGLQCISLEKFRLDWHPAALSCYIKSTSPVDSIWFEIDLFYNSTLVDFGNGTRTNFTNTYSKYVIPITQTSASVDSASIVILGYTSSGNYFLIDYLNFDSTYSDVNHFSINNRLDIFPNPTSGIFTIQSSEQISAIEIYNVLGENVYLLNHPITNSPIDLSEASSGVYFLQLSTEKGIARKKIVISR